MKMLKRSLVLLIVFATSGCAYNITPYSGSANNLSAIQKAKLKSTNKVSVGSFTAVEGKGGGITCRAAGNIAAPSGASYQDYIRTALIKELSVAEIYSQNSNVSISGKLMEIDFDSGISGGSWNIKMDFNVNGNIISAVSKYNFESAFIADAACTRVAAAFQPAVENLLNNLFKNPAFAAALGKS